jgi:hypothetical protein
MKLRALLVRGGWRVRFLLGVPPTVARPGRFDELKENHANKF